MKAGSLGEDSDGQFSESSERERGRGSPWRAGGGGCRPDVVCVLGVCVRVRARVCMRACVGARKRSGDGDEGRLRLGRDAQLRRAAGTCAAIRLARQGPVPSRAARRRLVAVARGEGSGRRLGGGRLADERERAGEV